MDKLKKILGSKGLWALIMFALLLLMRILFPSASIEDDYYWHERFLRGFDFAGFISVGVGIMLTVKGVSNKDLKQTVKGAVFVILGAALLYYVTL